MITTGVLGAVLLVAGVMIAILVYALMSVMRVSTEEQVALAMATRGQFREIAEEIKEAQRLNHRIDYLSAQRVDEILRTVRALLESEPLVRLLMRRAA